MARDQKNFQNYLYVDDNGVSWTKRGEMSAAAVAVDGRATGTNAPTWIDSSRMRARHVIWSDPGTFRQVRTVIYTAAAYAAIDLGDTIAVPVAGLATTVNFTAVKKVGEKQPYRGPARQLDDV